MLCLLVGKADINIAQRRFLIVTVQQIQLIYLLWCYLGSLLRKNGIILRTPKNSSTQHIQYNFISSVAIKRYKLHGYRLLKSAFRTNDANGENIAEQKRLKA